MSIRTETRYAIECDNLRCGDLFDGTDEQDQAAVVAEALADGWTFIGTRTFCPACRALAAPGDAVATLQPCTPTLLADTFLRLLREQLGDRDYITACQRNAEERPDSGVCHSHDFCDANMVMADALQRFGRVIPAPESADETLWNDAWALAFTRMVDEAAGGDPR